MVIALVKGLFDVFCYPTELADYKKDELVRFADKYDSGADIKLDNLEEQPLIPSDNESSNVGATQTIEVTRINDIEMNGLDEFQVKPLKPEVPNRKSTSENTF